MPKPTKSFKQRIFETAKILSLVVLLMFVASGRELLSLYLADKEDIRHFILVEVLLLTVFFAVATFWNIYRLIPRLLLRGKYLLYIVALKGMVVLYVLIVFFSEWMLYKDFQHYMGRDGLFANDNILVFNLLSNCVSYFFCFIATGLIVVLQYWWKSGERIHALEAAGVRVELEKERNKINSGALFDILDSAMSVVVTFPQEASRMLMDLSKSLRRQLYESDHSQMFPVVTEKTAHAFLEKERLLNYLTDMRYAPARNLLLAFGACLIGIHAIHPQNALSFVLAPIFTGIFLVISYFNIFVLIPRFLLQKKFVKYCMSITLLVVAFVLLQNEPSEYREASFGEIFIFVFATVAQTGFLVAGITAFVLFQHWARNERYIAELEASAMRAELEQLQNQINPHFLFNMLNNILVLIRVNPEEAVVILHKMSDMLKYQFNDSSKKEVSLKDDIHFLTDFLNLEKINRDRFEFTVFVENNTDSVFVPPLIFIPFVENAVKYSSDTVDASCIHLCFRIIEGALHFSCHNSKPLQPRRKNKHNGLGLVNVRRRLTLLYHEDYSLDIHEDETSYTAQLSIKISA